MFLHDINFEKFNIANGDTLTDPKHWDDEPFDAIVEFPGVLYRGGAEQKIRKYLVDNNYIDTIIQLPVNLFFGVGITT